MSRVKRGVTAHKRHKRLLNAAEGRKGTRSRLVKPAREALLHAMAYATRDRKQRKRQLRQLWIIRINAAARQQGVTYGALVAGLRKAEIWRSATAQRSGRSSRSHEAADASDPAQSPHQILTVAEGGRGPRVAARRP